MKQLIIGIVLAVLLVGCGEKPKFSINETDTLESYANNPIFTKIKISFDSNDKDYEKRNDKFGYQFTGAPVSINGIKTGDLNVIGGTLSAEKENFIVALTIKGKESFDKLEKRLNELQAPYCIKISTGNSRFFNCNSEQGKSRIQFHANYNHFLDTATFVYVKRPN